VRSGLLTAAACLAAAGAAVQAAGGAPEIGARVAEAAAGSVGARLARGGWMDRRASGTFADGPGRTARASVGTGRVEVGRGDPRLTALSVRRQLQLAGAGTYIGELLAQRDSALTRWPDRPAGRPLAVYVGTGDGLTGWRPEYVRQVAAAFAAWGRAGVPMQFRLVDDSSRADVRVRWIDRFAEPISGRTVWSRDDRWWMIDANVTLALHHSDGAPLDADQVRAIALHEVGHLLGLDHTADAANVMAPRVRVASSPRPTRPRCGCSTRCRPGACVAYAAKGGRPVPGRPPFRPGASGPRQAAGAPAGRGRSRAWRRRSPAS
jgi:hypothetical protein